MREDDRNKSCVTSEKRKCSEIDKAPDEIELNGIIGRLNKKNFKCARNAARKRKVE